MVWALHLQLWFQTMNWYNRWPCRMPANKEDRKPLKHTEAQPLVRRKRLCTPKVGWLDSRKCCMYMPSASTVVVTIRISVSLAPWTSRAWKSWSAAPQWKPSLAPCVIRRPWPGRGTPAATCGWRGVRGSGRSAVEWSCWKAAPRPATRKRHVRNSPRPWGPSVFRSCHKRDSRLTVLGKSVAD